MRLNLISLLVLCWLIVILASLHILGFNINDVIIMIINIINDFAEWTQQPYP